MSIKMRRVRGQRTRLRVRSEVKTPAPSASLRAGSVAQDATRAGHPFEEHLYSEGAGVLTFPIMEDS